MLSQILLTFSLFSAIFATNAGEEEQKPNVLFIIADDLSNTLGCYGAEGVISPNLDQLAAQGRQFERAYCQASLCNPSRASIMTGRRPHQLRIWSNQPHFRGVHPKIVTIPEHFKNNGYHSVGIGKVFHNWGQSLKGDPQSWSEPETNHYAAHFQDWYVPGQSYEIHSNLKKGPAVQCVDVPDEAYLDGRITNAAINKLRELRETPFFLTVGFWKPHLPYNAPKKYWDMYDREHLPKVQYPAPVEGVPGLAYVDSKEARSYTDVDSKVPIPEAQKQELRHGYLAGISYLDAQVGKILAELDRLDLRKNTIIVFVSDHGYHAGEHGQFGKWTNFEIGTRVPLIISAPHVQQAGTATTGIVELVDLFPTLTELCGIPAPKSRDQLAGTSLVPILQNPQQQVKKAALSQISRPLGSGTDFEIIGTSLRTEQYRYTSWKQVNSQEVVAEELYNLSKNLYTVENLIGTTKGDSKRVQLSHQLDELLKK